MHASVEYPGFKHILIIGVYLLSIFNLPRSISKPIATMEQFWTFPSEKTDTNDKGSICNFVNNMQLQATNARHHAGLFKNLYMLEDCKDWSLDEFFPNINSESKSSDEIDGSEFDTIDLNEFIKNAFHYLQKFAVGLDAMYKRQEDNSALKDETGNQINQLKSLLYEIHEYISSYDVTLFPDVTRNDLPEEYKSDMKKDGTKLMIFSCLLVRQYVNTLNYVHAGLSHFNQTDCKS